MNVANVTGNYYDKYETRNPIARVLMGRFLATLATLYRDIDADTVLEVGCGEGKLADHLLRAGRRPTRFVATDISLARRAPTLDPLLEFQEASAYELPFADASFDLVVCCEVMEHLSDPARALQEIARVARRRVLLSTPWEPVWRAMNLARGKYVRELGNTPGHIQHFGRRELVALAETRLRVLAVRRPLPWTVILGEPRR